MTRSPALPEYLKAAQQPATAYLQKIIESLRLNAYFVAGSGPAEQQRIK